MTSSTLRKAGPAPAFSCRTVPATRGRLVALCPLAAAVSHAARQRQPLLLRVAQPVVQFDNRQDVRIVAPLAQRFRIVAGRMLAGLALVFGNPRLPLRQLRILRLPCRIRRFQLVMDADAPRLGSEPGTEALLLPAQFAVHRIHAQCLECIRNGRIIRRIPAMGGINR